MFRNFSHADPVGLIEFFLGDGHDLTLDLLPIFTTRMTGDYGYILCARQTILLHHDTLLFAWRVFLDDWSVWC
jgi:hypothetical protein